MGKEYEREARYCGGQQRKNAAVPIQFDPGFRADSLTAGIRKWVGFGFRWIRTQPDCVAGQEGLEPPTSGFGDRRSTN